MVGPLPLRLDAKVLADLMEGGFDPPAEHQAAEDRHRFEVEIGARKRMRVTPAGWIADQNSAELRRW